jgi:hypothetical protein
MDPKVRQLAKIRCLSLLSPTMPPKEQAAEFEAERRRMSRIRSYSPGGKQEEVKVAICHLKSAEDYDAVH